MRGAACSSRIMPWRQQPGSVRSVRSCSKSASTYIQHLILCLLFLITSIACMYHATSFKFRSNPASYLSCAAPVWLIGRSESEHSLKLFLRQFSQELLDVCLLFEIKYELEDPIARHIHLTSWGTSHEYYSFILENAMTVILLNDDVYFYTSKYGVGKGDVSQNLVGNSSSLLLSELISAEIRIAPKSRYLTNAASILHRKRIYTRGIPILSMFNNEPDPPVPFESLPSINSTVSFPIIHHLPTSNYDCHPFFSRFQENEEREESLGGVHGHETSEINKAKALAFLAPALAPLPRSPVQYNRNAFWALASQLLKCNTADRIYDDIIGGLIVQRVLWESDSSLLVVHPSLDVINSIETSEIIQATEELLQNTVLYLRNLTVPKQIHTLPKVFEYICNYLATNNILSRDSVQEAVSSLKKFPVLEIARTRIHVPTLVNEYPSTAVCLTGQMRSAPFTHFNIISTLRSAIPLFDVFVVTPMDDRSSSAFLFNATTIRFSTKPKIHKNWLKVVVREARAKKLLHGTLSTDDQVQNYLLQLWDMRTCLSLINHRERQIGRKYDYIARVRPDIVFMKRLNASWWENAVASGKRHSFYGMNDRFFIGPRRYMTRLLSCHDLFPWLLQTSKIHRNGSLRIMTREINSERFLARCAMLKQVEVKLEHGINVRRVAWSYGTARWREF